MLFGFFKKLFSSSKPKPQPSSTFPESPPSIEIAKTVPSNSSSEASQTDCDYFSLSTSFNELLLGAQLQANQAPNALELDIINSVEKLLSGQIPESAVPRLPDVAMALLKELANDNISPEAIMSYINRDPALASEVLAMSNSALFRVSEGQIVNLDKALMVLGLNNLKTIVSSALMKRLMVIAPIYFRMFGQHLWQHSLDCGHACRALATFYGKGDPNNAYLVGLMHDVGKLAIFGVLTQALGQHLDYKPRGSVFSAIVRDHSQTLSARIASQWGLPDYLLTALAEQQDTRALVGDCSIYGFILNQANMLAEFKAIAEKAVTPEQRIDSLLVQYNIPLHLFREVFPEDFIALS
ncbi:MAG: HDOD domain-containing protein [Methylococcales bacterium]|nr:HDOD domain-containing protein [Methylococcaceae bacterium]